MSSAVKVCGCQELAYAYTTICRYHLSSRMAAHPSHLPSRSRASSWKTKPDLAKRLWKSLSGAPDHYQLSHADGEMLNCYMDLYEEGKNSSPRWAERDAEKGRGTLSHCSLTSWFGRVRNKWEEGEARIGQLTHCKELEWDRGVKNSFRTLHVLR